MVQLGLMETWGDWNWINDSPERMMAVTVDDVHRVMKKYLDPKVRTVAIYRTKPSEGGGSGGGDDAELATLLGQMPAEQQVQIKAALKRISESTDLAKMQERIPMMEQMAASGQVPDDQKPLMQYMLKAMKARATQLEAAPKESK
jgi:hypothetical protein